LAIHLFHDANKCFPTNGGYPPTGTVKPAIATVSGDGGIRKWGVGDPNMPPRLQTGSWAYSVLPFLEYEAAFRKRDFGVAVAVYMCPSRGRSNPQSVPIHDAIFPNTEYLSDGINPWGKTDFAANAWVALGKTGRDARGIRIGSVLSIDGVTDGASATILVGEKSMAARCYDTGGWVWDEPIFAGGSGGTARSGSVIQRDADVVDIGFENSWGSAHPVGCQVLWCDGSVHLLRYETPQSVVQSLLTPTGGEAPSSID
jgi:prepilin-type processing-associated H-X9-DG protein